MSTKYLCDEPYFVSKPVAFFSTIQRLDEFLELVAMSMEYAESTTAQLQPSSMLLDRKLLGQVHNLGRTIRDQIAATGGR